ncbi:uncharacterized protein CLUP02_18161 [Colletotrichum lupini]|uniref:Uncharacterized protein n=1 Tax=Colletotrichum lupini TaxID=145971 RepID=A0A9Q8SFW8_9PEZI|nr:uncharacterized protein CLUP02_18161 [Colletotrichum lupini]UQC76647.1 hypothetical protein CLUP02_18161 [Colletotrichum lupini]
MTIDSEEERRSLRSGIHNGLLGRLLCQSGQPIPVAKNSLQPAAGIFGKNKAVKVASSRASSLERMGKGNGLLATKEPCRSSGVTSLEESLTSKEKHLLINRNKTRERHTWHDEEERSIKVENRGSRLSSE